MNDSYLNRLLRDCLTLSYENNNTHFMSCITAMPIIATCYSRQNIGDCYGGGGVFILSKGHAWLAQATLLRERGLNPNVKLTHPNRDPANGVWCTTGSLGHGLPVAIGIAMAQRCRKVDVLCGDAECCEGTFWECINIIQHHRLHQLTVHVDYNGYGATGRTIDWLPLLNQKDLTCLNVHMTQRGKGVKLYEKNPEWHVHTITESEYRQMLEELK